MCQKEYHPDKDHFERNSVSIDGMIKLAQKKNLNPLWKHTFQLLSVNIFCPQSCNVNLFIKLTDIFFLYLILMILQGKFHTGVSRKNVPIHNESPNVGRMNKKPQNSPSHSQL